jgi:3',5'-cyclic AMP phosphodiesterase CpdA
MSERETTSTAPAPSPAARGRFDDAGPVLARLARPRAAERTTLAVLADPHLSTRRAGTWKAFHRTDRRLATAIADCNARGVDAALVAGDLTENGHRADFDRVHELLDRLDAPALAVPGNHDVPMVEDPHETPAVAEFERRFTPGGLPFHARVGGVDVVGLNTASAPDGSLYETHDGEVSPDALAWLEDTLAETTAPVVVGHHNLSGADDLDVPVGEWRSSFPLRDAAGLRETLALGDAGLYLSAHLHVPAVARPGGDVRELVCPPLCSFPQGYLLVRVGPEGTVVRYVPAADAEGTTEAYLAALKDNSKSEAIAELATEQMDRLPLADETSATGTGAESPSVVPR